jgi:hypothetical protein
LKNVETAKKRCSDLEISSLKNHQSLKMQNENRKEKA